jgi:hypothetical protein
MGAAVITFTKNAFTTGMAFLIEEAFSWWDSFDSLLALHGTTMRTIWAAQSDLALCRLTERAKFTM